MRKFLFAFIAFSLMAGTSCQKKSDVEENKTLIQNYTENFWNQQDIAVFDEYMTADFVIHQADGDLNAEQYKGSCQATFTAFPDIHVTTDILIAEGDKVVKVWTVNATSKGDYMGIPPTGNPMFIKGIEVFRIVDGKIAEIWVSIDRLGMLQQLGVIPPMGGESPE
jgi:steroid delta-isomerase-like uncharacterized protein